MTEQEYQLAVNLEKIRSSISNICRMYRTNITSIDEALDRAKDGLLVAESYIVECIEFEEPKPTGAGTAMKHMEETK